MTLRQRLSRCIGLVSILLLLAATTVAGQTTESLELPPVHDLVHDPVHPPDASPAHTITPELQGDLLCARQRYLDAIAAYQQAPQDSAVVANKIGVAYHHMFDLADAKRSYELAIRLNPGYAEAINNLGAVYHAEKNYRQAQRLYMRAIKLSPRSPLFYSNLGTSYFFEGNAKKGAEAYRKAFALDPEVFERSGASKIEELSSTKDLAAVNYELAKTYAQAGMNQRALAYLRRALGEGFNDRKKLRTDPELAALRETPEFDHMVTAFTRR